VAIADDLATMRVSDLDLSRYVSVDPSKTVTETIDAMRDAGHSCACVVDDGALVRCLHPT
jgi:CBS domain-containing protein